MQNIGTKRKKKEGYFQGNMRCTRKPRREATTRNNHYAKKAMKSKVVEWQGCKYADLINNIHEANEHIL